jgi:hypothetical protein
MDIILNIIRILTAVVSPAAVVCLVILTIIQSNRAEGQVPEEEQKCIRCGESQPGDEGQFHFTESLGNARERSLRKQLTLSKTAVLGSESHFVCDRCARRYIRNESLQLILMALPYPLYIFLIVPLFAENGVFANFLIETLLIVLSVGGFISAFDLFRAMRHGKTALSEARDRVAIHLRRSTLGKNFSYYTRSGITHLNK